VLFWRVDLDLRFLMLCTSLMSYRNISTNWGLVPIKFNLNWNPELKCLWNILWVFKNPFLRARLWHWEHELYTIRSIAFISTVVKSPDDACNIYQEFYIYSKLCSLKLAHCARCTDRIRRLLCWIHNWTQHIQVLMSFSITCFVFL